MIITEQQSMNSRLQVAFIIRSRPVLIYEHFGTLQFCCWEVILLTAWICSFLSSMHLAGILGGICAENAIGVQYICRLSGRQEQRISLLTGYVQERGTLL